MSAMDTACAVEDVSKHYGGVHALRGVSVAIQRGTVHSIVGENGAGKSTLMKVLAGATRPDSGIVRINGEEVRLGNVVDARRHGVSIVFQELSLYPDLDILTNLYMPVLPHKRGLVARSSMAGDAKGVLARLGVDLQLDRPVRELPLDLQQLVEVARALLARSDVLILDEPNSALNAQESGRVLDIVRQLRKQGVTVIYVSHRIEDVMAISDAITVMRNGAVVAEVDPVTTTIPQLIAAMIGERHLRAPESIDVGEPAQRASALRVSSVTVAGKLENTSFVASPGEVLGLAGLEESGVGAVFDLLFGLASHKAGSVVLPDSGGAPSSPAQAVRRGVARVPADRRTSGLMLERSVVDNLSSVAVCALGSTSFLVRRARLLQRVATRTVEMSIAMGSPLDRVTQLSGGNQQKVLLAKWLEAEPTLFLLDDPTRGVDVGAKAEIYQLVQAIAAQGRVVLFSSTDLREYQLLCARVLVFYRGTCVGQLAGAAINEHRLLEAVNTGRMTSTEEFDERESEP